MMVCSDHFKKEDFFPSTPFKTKKLLKQGVIPSQKIPVRMFQHEEISGASLSRKQRFQKRKQRVKQIEKMIEVEQALVEQEPHLKMDIVEEERVKVFEDKSVQVNTMLQFGQTFNIVDYILCNEKYTRAFMNIDVATFAVIKKAIEIIIPYFPNAKFTNIDLQICLTLIKLKTNMTFLNIGVLFGISNSTAANRFYEAIQILKYALKPTIYWHTKKETLKDMPKSFEKYKSVRVIIDATEIFVAKSHCLKCRIRTYSHYKKAHTMKFLICITPAGIISYVSKPYGGRVSDKSIFNQETIIT